MLDSGSVSTVIWQSVADTKLSTVHTIDWNRDGPFETSGSAFGSQWRTPNYQQCTQLIGIEMGRLRPVTVHFRFRN